MATLDGSTTTKKGQEIVTASYPGGKILETSIVAVGSPSGPVAVGTATGDKRMPVDALATLESTQMTDLLAGFTNVATAFTDVATEIAAHSQSGAETAVDSTGLTSLTASPGAGFAQVQELAAALNGIVEFLLTAVVPDGGTTGQALVKSSGTDYATEWSSDGAPVQDWQDASSGTIPTYIDRDRLWFYGQLEVANAGTSLNIGVIPSPPPADHSIACRILSDADGTPTYVDGFLAVASGGTVSIESTDTLTGRCLVYANGLSLRLTAPS